MARLPEYVVFDLETNADRPHPSEHEIIQIGAVLVSDEDIIDDFNTLVRPQRRLPEKITELTGIEFGQLGRAPSLEHALGKFFRWIDGRPMVAHNGFGYDYLVLDAAAKSLGLAVPTGLRLDTLELAHVVYPRAGAHMVRGVDGHRPPPGRSLDQLASQFGIDSRDKHDALNDARMTQQVMRALLDQLNERTPARCLQRWVLGRADHPWAGFVDPQHHQVALDDVVPEVHTPDQVVPTGSFEIARVLEMFGSDGVLMGGGREPRPQQAQMARLVCDAFGTPGHKQMIEAPTGTGKTLAYLVPAIEAARASGRVSVIAPHSRVLQDQILETLEELASALQPFSSVVLKGRNNYISLKALQGELDWLADGARAGPADDAAAVALAILCGWVAQTPSGDWADLRTTAVEGHLRSLALFRWKLRVDARPGPSRNRLDELDFYRRALERLRTAHVAVLNHALLAAGSALEDGKFNLVVDEAHNLEDSATAASTREVGVGQIEMLCDSLWDPTTGRGLAARVAAATGSGLGDDRIQRIRDAVAAVRLATTRLSEPLIEHVRDRTGVDRQQAARYGVSHRIVRGVDRRHPAYQRVEDAGRALRSALRQAADALDDIDVPEQLAGRYRRDALEDEKARLGREARNAAALVDAVLWAQSQLELFDDDLDEELAQWINIAAVSFEGAPGTTPANGAGAPEMGTAEAGRWRWALRRILGDEQTRPLNEREEKRARAVVNPEIVLSQSGSESLPLFQDPEIPPEDVIRVMDREQERVAEHLGDGYRVLRGVAGSGKTLVLAHRARYLHKHWPSHRILVLCYNRVLANALSTMVTPGDRLEVTNVDRLAYRLAGLDGPRPSDLEARVLKAEKQAKCLPDSERYDVVLVDEAQDLDSPRLNLAYSMLKPDRLKPDPARPDRDNFVMAYDVAQNVYSRGGARWNPPGVDAQGRPRTARGRTTVFRRNYRNTREILEFAMHFLAGSPDWSSASVDLDDPAALIPPEAAKRSGPKPSLTACRDLRGEAETIATRAWEMLHSGVAVHDIAVLYGSSELEKELQAAFSSRGLPYFHVQQRDDRGWQINRDKAVQVRDRVRTSTLTGIKGLEFSRVLVGGVNKVHVRDIEEGNQFQAAKSQLYAAMTRAMDELEITMSGSGEIGAALREAERLQ